MPDNPEATTKRLVAFVAVIAPVGFVIGIAEKDIAGYVRDAREPTFTTYNEAADRAEELNLKSGITLVDAFHIVASSQIASTEKNEKWADRG